MIPINFVDDGLLYVTIHPFTDAGEWDTLPHVILTSDSEWDPTVLDHTSNILILDDDATTWWFDAISNLEIDPFTNLLFNYFCGSNYHKHIIIQDVMLVDTVPPDVPIFRDAFAQTNPHPRCSCGAAGQHCL